MSNTTGDPVNHPSHYMGDGIEAWDVIESWGMGYHIGNATKYILRAGKKDDATQDAQKALVYIKRAMSNNVTCSMLADRKDGISEDRIVTAFGLTGHLAGAMVNLIHAIVGTRYYRGVCLRACIGELDAYISSRQRGSGSAQ